MNLNIFGFIHVIMMASVAGYFYLASRRISKGKLTKEEREKLEKEWSKIELGMEEMSQKYINYGHLTLMVAGGILFMGFFA